MGNECPKARTTEYPCKVCTYTKYPHLWKTCPELDDGEAEASGEDR